MAENDRSRGTSEETGRVSRRGALKAGALAVGAAVLPRAGAAEAVPGGALEQLRAEYQARIVALAEELEPRFRSGELRGYRDGDGNRFRSPPLHQLEDELRRRLARTFAEAHLVLLCSPSTLATFDHGSEDPRYDAGDAAAWDVLRVALARGWYRPEMEEIPDAESLLTAHLQKDWPTEADQRAGVES